MRKINTDLPDGIYSWTITALIDKINESNEDSELSWDSWGGTTAAGQKFIDFLNNRESKTNINTTGYAVSMGAVLVPFFDNSKVANQADVMIHSLAGGVKSTRRHTNELLYGALSKKIDEAKFKELFGKDLKEVMLAEDEDRVDIWMTGKQAAEIGLYDESYDLLTGKAANFESVDFTDIGFKVPDYIKEKYSKQAKIVKSNTNEMEIKDVKKAELQTGNPSVYNAILEEGKQAVKGSLSDERARVASIMKYAEYDMPKATEMIEKGATLEIADVEHFIEKKHASKVIDDLENDSEKDLNPGKKAAKIEDKRTDEEKANDETLKEEKAAMLEESGFELKTEKS
jgi:ATP-dependent protease ClpP protease subunit